MELSNYSTAEGGLPQGREHSLSVPMSVESSHRSGMDFVDMRERGLTAGQVRERGSTINPMNSFASAAQEEPNSTAAELHEESERPRAGSSVAEGAAEQLHVHVNPPPLLRQHTRKPSTGSREKRWEHELEQHAGFRRMLLFTGIEAPENWWSPWWCCWFGWRAVTVIQLFLQTFYLIYDALYPAVANVLCIDLPQVAAAIIALNCFRNLKPRVERLVVDEVPLSKSEIEHSVTVSLSYVVICTVATLAQWIYDVAQGTFAGLRVPDTSGGIPFMYLEGIYLGGCVVFHGAALLAFSLEATHGTNEVLRLYDAAEQKQLTRDQYRTAQGFVEARSHWWKFSMGLVALAAFYSTVAMVIVVHNPGSNPYWPHDSIRDLITEDIFHIAFLGKEVMMLFFTVAIAIRVNDNADSITTVLNREAWGKPGGEEEAKRMDLMLLTTTFSTTPAAARSVKGWLKAHDAGPISFRLCGLRPTLRLLSVAALSFFISMLSSIARTYASTGSAGAG